MIIFIFYLHMHMLDDKVRSNPQLSFCNYFLAIVLYPYSSLSLSLSLSLFLLFFSYLSSFEKGTTFHGRHKIRNVSGNLSHRGW